nr:immunoglobulin light chain junction region [Macaca mulatta]
DYYCQSYSLNTHVLF